jgi:hypothetical protein
VKFTNAIKTESALCNNRLAVPLESIARWHILLVRDILDINKKSFSEPPFASYLTQSRWCKQKKHGC